MNITFRDFQLDTMIEAYKALERHQRALLVSPTGSGKTVMAAGLIAKFLDEERRVLFLAPRRELIHQTCDKLDASLGWAHGRDYGVIMAGVEGARDFLYLPLQVASKDTLTARARRGALPYPRADVVIVDEAHLSMAETWQKLLQHYADQGTQILGLTATPCRQGGKGLGGFWRGMVQAPSVQELINLGFLVPGTYYAPTLPDLAAVRTDYRRGDFNVDDLENVMNGNAILGDVVEHWLRLAGGRRTVVFACSVKHSIALTERFLDAGVRAEHVDGMFDSAERDGVFKRFRAGDTQVLVNCALATYGFDLPELDCVVLARPTKSLALHLQMLGRGLRPAEGKQDCLVLDHAGNVNRLGFAEDPQPWSLDPDDSVLDRKEREREKSAKEKADAKQITCGQCRHIFTGTRTCPKCGWEVPRRGEDIEHAEGELVRVSNEKALQDLREEYRMFLGYAMKRGMNPGWAYHVMKEKHKGFAPPYSWKQMGPIEPNEAVSKYVKYLSIKRQKGRSKYASSTQQRRRA